MLLRSSMSALILLPCQYDACDVGTLKNQSLNGVPDTSSNGVNGNPLSFLPGQLP